MSASELTEEEKVRLQELTTQVIGGMIEDAELRGEMQRIMYPRTVALKSDRVLAAAEARGRAKGRVEGKAVGRALGIIDSLKALHYDHDRIAATLVRLLPCTPEEAEQLIKEYSATPEHVTASGRDVDLDSLQRT